jgi:hypothetical protein
MFAASIVLEARLGGAGAIAAGEPPEDGVDVAGDSIFDA